MDGGYLCQEYCAGFASSGKEKREKSLLAFSTTTNGQITQCVSGMMDTATQAEKKRGRGKGERWQEPPIPSPHATD